MKPKIDTRVVIVYNDYIKQYMITNSPKLTTYNTINFLKLKDNI